MPKTTPAYILSTPFTDEQVDGLFTDILPLVDKDDRVSGGALIVIEDEDKHYRLRDWLEMVMRNPQHPDSIRARRVFAFLNSPE